MADSAAIYCRVSTREQADSGTSLETQLAACRKFAAAHDLQVDETLVVREDHTGTDLERPGLLRLLGDAQSGRFRSLVIYTLDRLHRPRNEGDEWRTLQLLNRFKDMGVTVWFVDGAIPTSGPMASLIGIFQSWRAGAERRSIMERTARGRAAKLAQGKFLGRPPLGYSKDAEMRLVPDEVTQDVVRYIFDRYDRERVGVREIQKDLIGRYPSPAGGKIWYEGTVHRILSSEFYWTGTHRSGAPCPPIITAEQGRRVSERLTSNTRLKTGSKKERWPLQGIIYCHCGALWRCQPARRRQPADYYCRNRYVGSAADLRGEPRCTVLRMKKDRLEALVLGLIVVSLQDPVRLAQALDASMKTVKASLEEYGREVGPIDEALEHVRGQLKELERARIRRTLSGEELDSIEKELTTLFADLEARRAAYGPERLKQVEEARALLPAVEELMAWAEKGRTGLPVEGLLAGLPVEPGLARLLAIMPTKPAKAGEPSDWRRDMLTGLLDRLHAKITMYPNHIEVTGVLTLNTNLSAATENLHAYLRPRGYG